MTLFFNPVWSQLVGSGGSTLPSKPSVTVSPAWWTRQDSPLETIVIAEDSVTCESHVSRDRTVSQRTEHTGTGADQSCVAVPAIGSVCRTLSLVPSRNWGQKASQQAVLTGLPYGYRKDSGRVSELSPT